MEAQTTPQPGQRVKYSTPANEKEAAIRFIVLEISPARDGIAEKTTVVAPVNMNIKPVSTYFSTEFELAND